MRASSLALFSSACIITGTVLLWARGDPPLAVVPDVDLSRYQGKWYEIARLPFRFEKDCAGDVTAQYEQKPDGGIEVINMCRKEDGSLKQSKGVARLRDKNGPNSKLKVQFFWPFSGDYWILDLDPDYRWALVGVPGRKYLWVLSRTPKLPANVYERLLSKAQELGFDVKRVIRTKQSAGA
jgi:apolipoprotein D and lipocalin family protein